MGNYVFDADALRDAVTRDAELERSKHDMGGDIVPWFVDRTESGVYDYKNNEVPGSNERDRGYWRDVGTMRSYYEAHMDLVAPLPVFNLYNSQWPIFTSYGPHPPAKLVEGDGGAQVTAYNSILSPGVVVTGGSVSKSVLSPACRVDTGAQVSDWLHSGFLAANRTNIGRFHQAGIVSSEAESEGKSGTRSKAARAREIIVDLRLVASLG